MITKLLLSVEVKIIIVSNTQENRMEKRRKRKQLEPDERSKLKSSNRARTRSARTTNGSSESTKEPYPDYNRPTPEECRAVRDSLLALHGFPQEFAKYRRKSITDVVKSKPLDAENGTELDVGETILDGLVQTVLSQNTTNANSQKAFTSLKSSFLNWEDVLNADSKDVENAIRCGRLTPMLSSESSDSTVAAKAETENHCSLKDDQVL